MRLISHRISYKVPQKNPSATMSQKVYGTLCHMLTAFQNSFTIRRSSQFAIIIVITYATACQTCYHTTLWNIWQFDTVL